MSMSLKTGNRNGRLAIVDYDRCKPSKCKKECVSICPSNKSGKECITIGDISIGTGVGDIEDVDKKLVKTKVIIKNGSSFTPEKKTIKKALIANIMCTGCGLCVKACPFEAIYIVNLPIELSEDKQLISYGENSFRVYMSPHIKKSQCMGIIGSNGLGKTSIMKILSGETKIDLVKKKKLLSRSEIYSYLTHLNDGKIRVSYKPQDLSPYTRGRYGNHKVSQILEKIPSHVQERMNLKKLEDRMVKQLSGGETQRLLVSLACSINAQSYLFDEPSAFLDIKQRIMAANLIQDKVDQSYVVLVEHDLCLFDYISDYVVSLYGEKGAYGIISSVSGTFHGINNYLEGWLPAENIKFREKPIKFKTVSLKDEITDRTEFKYNGCTFSYIKSNSDNDTKINTDNDMKMNIDNDMKMNTDTEKDVMTDITNDSIDIDEIDKKKSFELKIDAGTFSTSEITLLIGENGVGKTTMIKILAGLIKVPGFDRPELSVSIKEQEVYCDSKLSVSEYIYKKIGNVMYSHEFRTDVMIPLGIDKLLDLTVCKLSGGQMQRVAIVMCLGTNADMYILDEPSAYIDVEDRLLISKILRHFSYTSKKSIFLVEHDMIMATSTCDKVIVFTGEPGIKCHASEPMDLKTGINKFLSILDVTMRRDASSGRPRINKRNSSRDREQKKLGEYFIID
jgi:ATP-binding cassette, sub-family E, member 1